MSSLNKVFLMGNLTRDPELRQLPNSGTSVCKLGLAVNRRYSTRGGEDREEVCFVDIEAWGRQAETCGRYLRKGSPALVEGRLKLDTWEDRETGRNRSRLLVHAERVQFLGAPGGGDDFGGTDGGYDNRQQASSGPSQPRPSSAPSQQRPSQPAAPPEPSPFEEINETDEDIPF